jgi:hypothetical protein
MILFKGRSSYKQYMPMKPVKRGYKVWCEADAHNGYLTSFEMYTGATQGSTEHGLGSSVVKRLSSPLAGKGYHLYFDNFFTSVDLAEDLLKDGLYCIGTARTNRKKWPQEMRDKKRMGKQLKRGEYICTNQGNVECIVWKDNKCVPFVNTITQPGSEEEIMRRNKQGVRQPVKCHEAVKLYNMFMGGVDIADARRKTYSCSRKSRRWWLRIFYFLVDISVTNSYILSQESGSFSKMSLKEYVLQIADQLMASYNGRKRQQRVSEAVLRCDSVGATFLTRVMFDHLVATVLIMGNSPEHCFASRSVILRSLCTSVYILASNSITRSERQPFFCS